MIKTAIVLTIFLLFGIWAGKYAKTVWYYIEQIVADSQPVYQADHAVTSQKISALQIVTIGWDELLPKEEKLILSRYQQNLPTDLTDQVLLSLQASIDKNYQATLQSTNVVTEFLNKAVSISGFIVPVDVHANRKMTSFFLVPYFGACIHYPPPPPNQLIYVSMAEGIAVTEFQTPYTVSGILKNDLYEDPLGTSAYTLDLLTIEEFYGEPDNFRSH